MTKVEIKNICKKIEPHLHEHLIKGSSGISSLEASNLMTVNRLDLGFKLFYLQNINRSKEAAIEFYTSHINALTLGLFKEPGNELKNSIDKYIQDFELIFDDIRINGFDSSKSIIPLSIDGNLMNGSHRVASAIYLGLNVDCISLECDSHNYDYKFFEKRKVNSSHLEAAVTSFIEFSSNCYLAFLWPTSNCKDSIIEENIPNILYKKDITLNALGALNLIFQIYSDEPWLGSKENRFQGAKSKAIECFQGNSMLKIVAFKAVNLDEVLKIKSRLRKIFNNGKHSVHITDNKAEAVRASRLIFNENSIHFLNHADYLQGSKNKHELEIFRTFLVKNKIDTADIVIDGSSVLDLYGIRQSKDVDFLLSSKTQSEINISFSEIYENHESEIKYHRESKENLIYNPLFHFYFNDLKFISFNQLYIMKKNRGERKDLNDIQIMKSSIDGTYSSLYLAILKQKYSFLCLRFKITTIRILKILRIHSFIKGLYYYMFGRS